MGLNKAGVKKNRLARGNKVVHLSKKKEGGKELLRRMVAQMKEECDIVKNTIFTVVQNGNSNDEESFEKAFRKLFDDWIKIWEDPVRADEFEKKNFIKRIVHTKYQDFSCSISFSQSMELAIDIGFRFNRQTGKLKNPIHFNEIERTVIYLQIDAYFLEAEVKKRKKSDKRDMSVN